MIEESSEQMQVRGGPAEPAPPLHETFIAQKEKTSVLGTGPSYIDIKTFPFRR